MYYGGEKHACKYCNCSKSKVTLCKKNITIKKLSSISGISELTIKNTYNGTAKRIGVRTILQLCNAFGITAECFFNCDLFNKRDT